MKSKSYIVDRALHWISALLLLFMLLNLSSQLHNVDWDIKGQLEHRQDAVELHAFLGIMLLVFTASRIIFPYLTKTRIERVSPTSKKHAIFIKVTHLSLYSCIFLLAATGLALINNYQIPLTVFGIELAPDKDAFYQVFPGIHDIHMVLKQLIWWLIAIHFFGIMYAKR
ncbi:cytochrome b/b6 domain-containing protein [Rheinheimera fenheensis]|uniref:cytochrome b/b6 domain-containing protein n=1 Tax=Rheinheimera fenheensis TaxID=3152295 RepID=UPI00325E6487